MTDKLLTKKQATYVYDTFNAGISHSLGMFELFFDNCIVRANVKNGTMTIIGDKIHCFRNIVDFSEFYKLNEK